MATDGQGGGEGEGKGGAGGGGGGGDVPAAWPAAGAYFSASRLRAAPAPRPSAVMPTTIRSRLQLMMMTVMLPGVAVALFLVARTYQGGLEAVQRNLRGSALAMAQVIDRELTRRLDIAGAMATSNLMPREPETDPDLLHLHAWASRIAQGLGGWIELHSAAQLLMDTRTAAGSPPRPHAAIERFALSPVALVLPQVAGSGGVLRPAQVVQPVWRPNGQLLNLVITIPADVLQGVIDEQRLPTGWLGTVMDSGLRVVARHPGGAAFTGLLATPDLQARMGAASEGEFTSVSLDGTSVVGYFRKTPQGWSYVTAAPRGGLVGDVPLPVLQVVVGALLLLAAAMGASVWVGRRIAQAAESLKASALALQDGAAVLPQQATGIVEFDAVGSTLAAAAGALAHARHDLERQVADAVARTRLAEQRVSQGQRIAALGLLTGGVAHDFNNLLGVISNSAHLIDRHAAALPALQMPVAVTLRAVQMGSHLTQQLLRFGGRQPVSPRPVNLADYLPEVGELLQMVVRKPIAVDIEVQPGTPSVQVDPSELELALIHVALNARDAMPEGGRLRVHARRAGDDEADGLPAGHYVLVALTDNGVGMDEQRAAQVFEPFFTTKPMGQGTGLGLSQVHGFCVQSGGNARIGSTPGFGTTVTLVLPAHEPAAATLRGPGDDANFAEATDGDLGDADQALAGVRLLLVEDNDELAEVTALLLQTYGCQVRRARNVDDALAKIAEDDPLDLVLTDVVMPGARNGVDLAQWLRRTRPALPVVLISGYSAALAGLTDFTVLRKPVAVEDLVRTLVAALAGAAARADAGADAGTDVGTGAGTDAGTDAGAGRAGGA